MALDILHDVTSIGGFHVIRGKPNEMSWDNFDKMRRKYPIHITDSRNMISFRLQNGPVKENGVNGCDVGTMILTARMILEGLEERIPCTYNRGAIFLLSEVTKELWCGAHDRKLRGVDGTDLP